MHVPVLTKEVSSYLAVEPDKNFIDCTLGEGGHARKILEKGGRVLGLDWDKEMIERARKRLEPDFGKRLILVNKNFVHLKEVVKREGFGPVAGVLFDLGMSRVHIEESGRGFTFKRREPLLMKYREEGKGLTAYEIVNRWPEKKIEEVLRKYGEEKYAEDIAEEIGNSRNKKRITYTTELADIVKKVKPEKGRIHPATKTFQALRIAVNHELQNLKEALPQAADVMEKEGRLVVISFHSLEDKIVKNFLKQEKRLKVLTKSPVRADKKEVNKNPSSRSARLRAAEKI